MKNINAGGTSGGLAYESTSADKGPGKFSDYGNFSQDAALLQHPHRISLYANPPSDDINLEDLERLALKRIHLLKAIETASIRQLKDEEYATKMKSLEDKYMPLHSNAAIRGYPIDEERKSDITSHFILRLGFCMKEDTRRWFVNYESQLFRFRYNNLTSDEKMKFLQTNLPYLVQVTDEEKYQIQRELASASGPSSLSDVFYKVPFENVCDLVIRRAVYLRNGMAYVPRAESLSIILTLFKTRLEKDLEDTARSLPRLNEEERLLPVLLNLCKASDDLSSDANSMGSSTSKLLASEVDKAVVYFPPCMQYLHGKLKENAHLKHGGRMQYGLYLKSIGLSLDEAVIFWKKAFAKKASEDQFQKNYLYNIRHNYGQEGKRANYAPYSCHKIITTSPPYAGDHHGCPFKHFGKENLQSYLTLLRAPDSQNFAERALTPAGIREIMDLASQHHYQIACTRLFELSSKINSKSIETVSYPHQFYEWRKLSVVNDNK